MAVTPGLSNLHAVLIGFNKYKDQQRLPDLRFAEKDAYDLQNVLTEPNIGNYPEENIKLIVGNAGQGEIEEALYTTVVKNRNSDDNVLVYYSGHGFVAGEEGDVYLATPSVTITEILNNPRAGLKMEDLLREYFLETKAKNVIFILDCCNSGSFLPQYHGRSSIEKYELLDNKLLSSLEGRMALVSSPRGVESRESKSFKNGIFTYHLLSGLKGGAVEPGTRVVTINSLASYVQAKSPASQQPVLLGQFQRLVLTSPSESIINSDIKSSVFKDRTNREVVGISALPNSIEKEVEFIDIILESLRRLENSSRLSVGDKIIEAMRESVGAEVAFVESAKEDNSISNKYIVTSNHNRLGEKEAALRDSVLQTIYPILFEEREKLLESRYGLYKPLSGIKNRKKIIILIPLSFEYPREYLIFYGVHNDKLENGELMGQILISLYKASQELMSMDIIGIENSLLDDIRKHFGFVPIDIYNRRLKNFIAQLQRIKFAYEPVIHLGSRNPQINSWEALARDPETGRAPSALFQTARLWGNKFLRILDLYCLDNATRTYFDMWKSERGQTKKDPLSVNVYPNTLYTPEYHLEIERIVSKEDLLKGRELILEISEQQPIPYIQSKSNKEGSLSYFEKQLYEYHQKFDISFAVDDFGSGYASIGRMTKLELSHIKIDREILGYRYPLETIKYVVNTVRGFHKHQKTDIVVEGYDGFSRVSLLDLFDSGVKYVQGHLLRRASETVRDLDENEIKFIVDSLNSSKPKNPFIFEEEGEDREI